MAIVTAVQPLDMAKLDLSVLDRHGVDSDFADNINIAYNGRVYQDVASFEYFTASGEQVAYFGGTGIVYNLGAGSVTAGTVTGVVVTDGSLATSIATQPVEFRIEGMSISAVTIYAATQTAATSDDQKVLATVFKGNDTLNMSTQADVALGYAGNDTINGNAGNDKLLGGLGNDTLAGGLGKDILTGDAGKDFFVFNVAPIAANADKIADFSHAQGDWIELSHATFAALGAAGSTLGTAQFWSAAGATSAHDATDRIVYNTTTGNLYYDDDGKGGHAAQLIATLGSTTHPALVYGDIHIIA